MPQTSQQPVLSMEGIHKSFGRVQALEDVDFRLYDGEVVGLVGDNGAGKSTLIRTLVGTHTPDSGQIYINQEPVTINDPSKARQLGITTVYQDLALVDELSVAANMFLGRPKCGRKFGFKSLDWSYMRERSNEILSSQLNVSIDPSNKVEFLSGGERQSVAIGRALVTDPDILILDEPTSALSADATERVKDLVLRLNKEQNINIVLISHDLAEIFSLCDRLTVLKNGRNVTSVEATDTDEEEVVQLMVAGTS